GARRRRTGAGGTLREGPRGIRRARRLPQEEQLGLLHDDDRAAADGRLRRHGLTGRPRGVDPRASRLRAVDVRRRSRKVADEGRRAGQHHAVLADEQRDLGSAAVLGERRTKRDERGRAEDRRDLAPRRPHGIPGGRLSAPGDLGPARLSQPDLLPRGRQGRTLRRMGRAGAFLRRAARRLQIASESAMIATLSSTVMHVFVRFDAGEFLRKERGGQGPKIPRLVVGNPLIMKEMAKTVPDAAVTILVDERADGVRLSYDSMASLIASYGSPAALVVARDLDAKIELLLRAAAR